MSQRNEQDTGRAVMVHIRSPRSGGVLKVSVNPRFQITDDADETIIHLLTGGDVMTTRMKMYVGILLYFFK